MASRHQRRKRAFLKKCSALINSAANAHFQGVRDTVKRNKAQPIERNYYSGIPSSVVLCQTGPGHGGRGFNNPKLWDKERERKIPEKK